MNLIEILEQDSLKPTYKTANKGGEYASACPWCGGNDRFISWPNQGKSGRYWCRQCGKAGDSFSYLKERQGLSYSASQQVVTPNLNMGPADSVASREYTMPPPLWMKVAEQIMLNAQRMLWAPAGETSIELLRAKGLQDSTIRRAGLGYIHRNLFQARPTWGLEEKTSETGRSIPLLVPVGILIPAFWRGNVIRLRVRKEDDSGGRYHIVTGSSTRPMVLGGGHDLCVVESELDALLIYQEAGHMVQTVAMGSVSAKPYAEVNTIISKARTVLVSLDADEAGAKSKSWWGQNFKRSKRWPPVKGKDPSEAHQNGLNIATWIQAGLTPKGHSLKKIDEETGLPIGFFKDVEATGALPHVLGGSTDAMQLLVPVAASSMSTEDMVLLAQKTKSEITERVQAAHRAILTRMNINPNHAELIDFKLEAVSPASIYLSKTQRAFLMVGDADGPFTEPRIVTKGMAQNRSNATVFTKELEMALLRVILEEDLPQLYRYRKLAGIVENFRKRFEVAAAIFNFKAFGKPVHRKNDKVVHAAMTNFEAMAGQVVFAPPNDSGFLVYCLNSTSQDVQVVLPHSWVEPAAFTLAQRNGLRVNLDKQWKLVLDATCRKILDTVEYEL